MSPVTVPTRSGWGRPFHHVTAAARTPTVVALVVGPRERARVKDGLQARMRIEFAATLEEMRALSHDVDDASLFAVLVEARDVDGMPVSPMVRQLVAERPTVPVVAICDPGAGLSRDLLDLAQAGTHEVVIRGVGDQGHTLRQAIESGQRTSAGARTLVLIAPSMPEELRAMLELCVYYPAEAKSVARVARALGVHRKTLVNHCARAGFPPPATLISWCRVLHAAVLLSTTGKPVDQIARLLEFSTGSAFRNLFRRYTGMRPTDVRNREAFACVVEGWREVMERR